VSVNIVELGADIRSRVRVGQILRGSHSTSRPHRHPLIILDGSILFYQFRYLHAHIHVDYQLRNHTVNRYPQTRVGSQIHGDQQIVEQLNDMDQIGKGAFSFDFT
jgi:hypothetical protein